MPGDLHRPRLQPQHEEDHVADRPEHAESLDGEEVAGVEGLPVRAKKGTPSALSAAFWGGFGAGFDEDPRDGRPTHLDREPAQGVADARVAPARVLPREREDETPDLVRLAWPAQSVAQPRAVVFGRSKLPEPIQDRARADDLAERLALIGLEGLALEGKPASLFRREVDRSLKA
jgi:hypothetical protein